jgi:hypothetical protein
MDTQGCTVLACGTLRLQDEGRRRRHPNGSQYGLYPFDAATIRVYTKNAPIVIHRAVADGRRGPVDVHPTASVAPSVSPPWSSGIAPCDVQPLQYGADVTCDVDHSPLSQRVQRAWVGIGIGRVSEGSSVAAPDGDGLTDVDHLVIPAHWWISV